MLHKDKEEFVKLINSTSMRTGFLPIMLEKDYYLTTFLSNVSKLSENLGLPQKSINEVKDKISQELYPVLSIEEQEKFNLDKILHKINLTIGKVIKNHIDFS
ncbi:MAG: hypothetical protein LBP57_02165 [Endomicrobium sp.]|jgi:hypothetical protein|nr:hypothetical protein [Endomicrobium sp.]